MKIMACELESGEVVADSIKRGLQLKGSGLLVEVQQFVMKDLSTLTTYNKLRTESLDLLRAGASQKMPMEVDGALWGKGNGRQQLFKCRSQSGHKR